MNIREDTKRWLVMREENREGMVDGVQHSTHITGVVVIKK